MLGIRLVFSLSPLPIAIAIHLALSLYTLELGREGSREAGREIDNIYRQIGIEREREGERQIERR
jgi:hypothetical protein